MPKKGASKAEMGSDRKCPPSVLVYVRLGIHCRYKLQGYEDHTVLEDGCFASRKEAMLNRPSGGPELHADVPAARLAHSWDGVLAPPGYRQLRPMIAIGSSVQSLTERWVPSRLLSAEVGSGFEDESGMGFGCGTGISSGAWPILPMMASSTEGLENGGIVGDQCNVEAVCGGFMCTNSAAMRRSILVLDISTIGSLEPMGHNACYSFTLSL